ncbi:MAG: class I SAM-dependent methyltransferase [Candidatus Thermoplasmatota archaeon]|nr:class I SAM-dependent methyltransferase [Candidatus Thermoplasmatota archaeon]
MSNETTWDLIAESFDATRKKPWPQCLSFIHSLKKNSTVVDIGCGNGRHLLACATHCAQAIGVDISRKLLTLVQKKISEQHIHNVMLLHANAIQLPLADNSVDAVLCIASLHNIRGRHHRRLVLQEIARVLQPDGSALITVWSRWQKKYWKQVTKNYLRGAPEFGDIDIYWRQHRLNVPRFYHLYSKREFIKEVAATGLSLVSLHRVHLQATRFSDNYFAVVQKR